MATTTIRLGAEEERTLDELAKSYGGRSQTLRAGLRLLAESSRRRAALTDLLDEWESEAGPVDEATIASVAERYGI